MNYLKLAQFVDKHQYKADCISFRNSWGSWKLAYDDVLLAGHPSLTEVMDNLIERISDYENYKIVLRGSGNVLAAYLCAFVSEEEKPELPYYMLSRSEILRHCEEFLERTRIEDGIILFETDDMDFAFERGDLIEEYGEDARDYFVENELWELIYFGHFDPSPLTRIADPWGRRILEPDESIPRV